MVELILGDCMEAIGALEDGSIDAVITDPPYGISYKSGRSDRFEVIAGDDVTQVDFIGAVLPKLRDTGCMAVFSRWDVQQKVADAMSAAGLDVTSVIVWDKDSHGMGDLKKGFAPGYETIVFGAMPGFSFPAHRPKNIIRVKKVGGGTSSPERKADTAFEVDNRSGDTAGGRSARLLHGKRHDGRGLQADRPELCGHGDRPALLQRGTGSDRAGR